MICPRCKYENEESRTTNVMGGAELESEELEEEVYNSKESIEEAKFVYYFEKFRGIYSVFFSLVGIIISIFIFVLGADQLTKITGIPVLIISISTLIYSIAMVIRSKNIKSNLKKYEDGKLDISKVNAEEKKVRLIELIANNLFVFMFLLSILGFAIFYTIICIQDGNEGGVEMLVCGYLVLFGIICAVIKFAKDKNK